MDGPWQRTSEQIRLVVIEDHELLSSSLRTAFAVDGRATVVAVAGSIAAGLSAVAAFRPDVVLTDRRLPDGDMDEHISALRAACPSARIVLMTGWPTQRSSLAALDSGVAGIVTKQQPVGEILDAVVRVVAGHLVVPLSLTHALLARAGRSQVLSRNDLSRRELDVLEALACGESTVEVAQRLCVSTNTVRNHLARAMLKLGVHNRLAAVSEAIRLGLVAPKLPSVDPQYEAVACR
jgi:two-component system, NarL family, nitrate/nitrite response regulator NarL